MPRFHGGDHVVDGAALEGVHGRGPGMVEMAQLRVVPAEFKGLSALQPERHPPVRDGYNLGGAAVHQPQPGIVAGPADAIAGAKLDAFCPVDLAAAPAPADLARPPSDRPAVPAFQHDLAGLVVHARHAAFVALPDADPLVGAVERHHVADRVVAGKRLLRTGVAPGDQAFALEGGARGCGPRGRGALGYGR